MTWIEPLEMKTWFIQVFAGNPDIFLASALFIISLAVAFFRMNTVALFFMIAIFLLMFSGYVSGSLIVILSIVGGLIVGYFISRFIK